MNTRRRVSQQPHRKATYQDVLDAPPNRVAEVIAGTLHTQPRPAARHAWASSGMGGSLFNPFSRGRGGPGGWWIIDEPELHLGEDIVVPDLAGWRRETMPDYPDAAYFEIAPDWVCEVLSPSTRRIDLGDKREIYAREGVRHLWFVEPTRRHWKHSSSARANGFYLPLWLTMIRSPCPPSTPSPSRSMRSGRNRPEPTRRRQEKTNPMVKPGLKRSEPWPGR